MFTQFFGSYLLNKKIVSPANLRLALEKKDSTRVKLGVLAINAGYMTSKQVDAVHRKQATVDKRIGDIAVEMGYLTEAQVEELLSSQKTGCLLLGQALVDMGCLTNEEFEMVLTPGMRISPPPMDSTRRRPISCPFRKAAKSMVFGCAPRRVS